MGSERRVLIIGGGIGGMALAAALHRLGLQADVYEQAPQLREVGAGLGLFGNALFALEQLGAADRLRREFTPFHRVAFASPGGRLNLEVDLRRLGGEAAALASYVVHRASLLAAIQERVPAQHLHTGKRCLEVSQDSDGVRATFEDGEVVRAAVGIGADGLGSVVRRYVVQRDALRYSGQTIFRGIARVAPSQPGTVVEIQGRGLRCSPCPLTDRSVYWWAALNAPPGQAVPAERRGQLLLERFRGWSFGVEEMFAATPTGEILQNDMFDRPPVRGWSRGRWTLLGDAAHPTTPNLGQGANMAIDDAVSLARALHRFPAPEEAMRRYELERGPRTARLVRRAWQFAILARWTHPAAVAAREALVRHAPRSLVRRELRFELQETVGPLGS